MWACHVSYYHLAIKFYGETTSGKIIIATLILQRECRPKEINEPFVVMFITTQTTYFSSQRNHTLFFFVKLVFRKRASRLQCNRVIAQVRQGRLRFRPQITCVLFLAKKLCVTIERPLWRMLDTCILRGFTPVTELTPIKQWILVRGILVVGTVAL